MREFGLSETIIDFPAPTVRRTVLNGAFSSEKIARFMDFAAGFGATHS